MASNMSFQESMKSLVKIIYEKEKQIQKYKGMLIKSQASKSSPLTDQSNISKQIKQASKMITVLQKKVDSVSSLLTQQMQQNQSLHQNNQKMQEEIRKLKQEKRKMITQENQFQKENQKLKKINQQIMQKYTNQVSKKEEQFNTSLKYKNLLEQINKSNQKTVKQYQAEIQNYQLKVESLQNQLHEMQDRYKSKAQDNFSELHSIINSQNNQIIEVKKQNNLNQGKIKDLQQQIAVLKKQNQQILKNHEYILIQLKLISEILKIQSQSWYNISQYQYMIKVLTIIKTHLLEEQSKRKNNQTDFFINETLHGISRIKHSFEEKLDQLNEDEFNTSQFQINQDMLIQNLQKQCQNQSNHSKLVELSQVRQNLKMTKEVNIQLFDEINRQEKVIREFKSSFRNFLSLNQQKLSNLEQIKSIAQLVNENC